MTPGEQVTRYAPVMPGNALSQHLEAIAKGTGMPSDIDASLLHLVEAIPTETGWKHGALPWAIEALDDIQGDVISDALAHLGDLKTPRGSLLAAVLCYYEQDEQSAMNHLIDAGGTPPEVHIVQAALMLASGASPEGEERLFLTYAESVTDRLARAGFFAHVGAAYYNHGLDPAPWVERSIAAVPEDDERLPYLRSYFRANELDFARAILR